MNAKTYVKDIAENEAHLEGPIAKSIEEQTAKIPSDAFLTLALGSIAASATLRLIGAKSMSNFVGQWAPTILILGLYNKLVRVAGSDQLNRPEQKSQRGSRRSSQNEETEQDDSQDESRSSRRSARSVNSGTEASGKRNRSSERAQDDDIAAPNDQGTAEGLQHSASL